MMWVSIFNPYFFEDAINQIGYLTMLHDWLIPQLQEQGLLSLVTAE